MLRIRNGNKKHQQCSLHLPEHGATLRKDVSGQRYTRLEAAVVERRAATGTVRHTRGEGASAV